MKVTTHLHLVPTLRMRVGLPLLTLYTFIEWTETILHMPLVGSLNPGVSEKRHFNICGIGKCVEDFNRNTLRAEATYVT